MKLTAHSYIQIPNHIIGTQCLCVSRFLCWLHFQTSSSGENLTHAQMSQRVPSNCP
jgi:hypothetical protein